MNLKPAWRWIGLVLVLWMLPAMACNYPVARRAQVGISALELRQTLEAQDPNWQNPVAAEATATPEVAAPGVPTQPAGEAATAVAEPPAVATSAPPAPAPEGYLLYLAQSGDTLPALALRFAVDAQQISSPQPVPADGLIPPGQALYIPDTVGETPYPATLLPDSEVVASPSSAGFPTAEYIQQAGGYLNSYSETVDGQALSGAQIVARVAADYSISPRLLLGLLDYRAHWVTGQPGGAVANPIGFNVPGVTGLYRELELTAKHLNIGFYGWKAGTLVGLKFTDGGQARISPALNAGSVALQYLFTRLEKQAPWQAALYGEGSFPAYYLQMFGDPWERDVRASPLLPAGLAQPEMELPFAAGERWSFTGGPHPAWDTGSPAGAIDLAPVTGERACSTSRAWALAPAAGVITRSGYNGLALDLDGDGYEETGWVLFFYHLSATDLTPAGTVVSTGDRLGHPSCEGGRATGTHVHVARKYNGVWLPAGMPLPFVLSGWTVIPGAQLYQGYLVKGEQTVTAHPGGGGSTIIMH